MGAVAGNEANTPHGWLADGCGAAFWLDVAAGRATIRGVMEPSNSLGRSPESFQPDRLIQAARSRDVEFLAFAALAGTMFGIAFSIALGQMAAGLCFALTAVGFAGRRIRFRWPGSAWWAVAFGAVAVLSIIRGLDPHHLWSKARDLLWFLLIPVTAMLVRSPERARHLILAFVAGCVVQSIETCVGNPIRAWRHPNPDFVGSLINLGSMTDGQMLMLGLVITLVLLVMTWRTERRVSLGLALALFLQAGGLLLDFKRGSWFCAALLAGGFVLSHARWRTGLLLLATLALLAVLPPVQTRLGQLGREFDVKGGGRLTMWLRVTPALVKAYPGGVGYGALTNELMRKACRRVEHDRNHVHANWAQILAETGWMGLAIYVAWMAWLVGAALAWVRAARSGPGPLYAVALGVFMGVAGLMLNGLVEYNFGDVELTIVLAVFAGLIAVRRAGAATPAA